MENLLPVLNGDAAAGKAMARALFRQFALKLTDLWRYEAGYDVGGLFQHFHRADRFVEAYRRKRGVLLLTVHIGNWEFGAPLLAARGIPIQVITLAEPDDALTQLRTAARARWGVETVPLGRTPFAAVEILRRLEAGKVVALLVDRPTSSSAAEVALFGRPFQASIAAAELARASGSALIPVILPRLGSGYAAETLPEISYDRAALSSRAARIELTQQILSAFEPAIRQYASQWFHFVPVWPKS